MTLIARLADILGRRPRLGMVKGGFDPMIGETHRIVFGADGPWMIDAAALRAAWVSLGAGGRTAA